MSLYLNGERIVSIGESKPLDKETILEYIEDMKKAFDNQHDAVEYRFVYMNDATAKELEWYDQDWYEGPGIYKLDGEFIEKMQDSPMEPVPIKFIEFDEIDTFDYNTPMIESSFQSGKDKADLFNKRKKKKK